MTSSIRSSLGSSNSLSHTIVAVATCACLPAAADPSQDAPGNGARTEFEEAYVFFELNNTDNDLGLHAKIDGGPWTRLGIENAKERRLLSLRAAGPLWHQQLTELFIESEEPDFDEVAPEQFFERFPAGVYGVHGWSRDVGLLESETEVSHVMPAAPAPVTVNGILVIGGYNPVGDAPPPPPPGCEAEPEDLVEVMPSADGSVLIDWDPVTASHPEIGAAGPVAIVNYEVIVEAELEVGEDEDAEEFVSVFSVVLPADVTEMSVPPEMLALTEEHEAGPSGTTPPRSGAEFLKIEVLAREASFNQTAVEGCFRLLDADANP